MSTNRGLGHLQHVDGVVSDIAGELFLTSTAGKLWQVDGHATAGKSTVLHELAQKLDPSLVPVLVSPPAGALDAGPVALAQVAAGLKLGGLVNGDSAALARPERSLSQKVDDVRGWLSAHSDRVVLLCDEPVRWAVTGHDDAHFARRTWAVVAALLEAPCRRVVAGKVPEGQRVDQIRDLDLQSAPMAWLRDGSNWGSLADSARGLANRPEADLRRYSPLQLRFLVALDRLGASPPSQSARDLTRRELSAHVARELASTKQLRALSELWAKLALIRRPFEADVLALLGGDQLDPLAKDLLHHCLLYRRGDRFVLHETLRQDAQDREWLDDRATRDTHRKLATAYTARFLQTPTLLVDQLEAYYHAMSSGDASLFRDLQPTFVEQLDALGRARSIAAHRATAQQRAGLYDGAVECFRQSIAWDDLSAYAHHYLAFNLDIQAKNTDEVEEHYQRAVDLEPRSPWFHSRWICYLVTRSQLRRAEHAWDDAIDALGSPSRREPNYVYEGLHRWVARILLHRGHLAFAKRVLDHLPSDIVEASLELRALRRHYERLAEARDRRAFLPVPFLVSEWWKQRPPLLRAHDGGTLLRWVAARVDEVDMQGKTLHLVGGEIDTSEPREPTPKLIEVSFSHFDGWDPDEKAKTLSSGRFVELGTYRVGKSTRTRARIHAKRPWVDDELPALFPEPTRWLQALRQS